MLQRLPVNRTPRKSTRDRTDHYRCRARAGGGAVWIRLCIRRLLRRSRQYQSHLSALKHTGFDLARQGVNLLLLHARNIESQDHFARFRWWRIDIETCLNSHKIGSQS